VRPDRHARTPTSLPRPPQGHMVVTAQDWDGEGRLYPLSRTLSDVDAGDAHVAGGLGDDELIDAVAQARTEASSLLAGARARMEEHRARALAAIGTRTPPGPAQRPPGATTPTDSAARWRPPVPPAHSRPSVLPAVRFGWSTPEDGVDDLPRLEYHDSQSVVAQRWSAGS
jgi:hypothetical protein